MKKTETESKNDAPAAASCSALLRLLTAASLMRITIKERATFLTKTTDWERLEGAMRNAERELKEQNVQSSPVQPPRINKLKP